MISKWKYNYTDEEKGIALTIQNKNQEIEKLVDELEEQEQHIKEANLEIERLKNDIKRITNICNEKIKIINDVREYIEEKKYSFCDDYDLRCENGKEILQILDKENK